MTNLLRDIRRAARALLLRPGFAFTAIATLALGIGANALVFALIDGIYFGELPYRDADALVDVYATAAKQGGGVDNVSIPDYVDLAAGVPAFADSALYTDVSFNLVDNGAPERLHGLKATPSLFSTLGAGAALGRTYDAAEAVAGRDRVVVLTDTLWRERFNANPAILGQDLRLDGESYRVVGVMAKGFMFPNTDVGFFVPFTFAPTDLVDDKRGENYSSIVARLAPGSSAADVEAQSAAVVRRNVERVGATGDDGAWYAREIEIAGFRFGVRPLREQLSGSNARQLVPLQLAVLLVLLVACANIANLLLSRMSSRHSEFAVRSALGASRARIVRELSVEALLIAFGGALLGLVIVWFGARLIAASGMLPHWASFGVDARVIAFTVAIALVTCAGFGAFPIWSLSRLRTELLLREGTRLSGGSRNARRLRGALVVVQLALAVALLAGGGLLLRSFTNAMRQNPGFVSDNVLIAGLALPSAKYTADAARARHLRQILDAARTVRGVTAAGATTVMPFTGNNAGLVFRIEGRDDTGATPHAALRRVDEDYFKALSVPILKGRTFTRADWETQARTVVVDASFAHRYFPDADPVGKRIFLGSSGTDTPYTIVGVVGAIQNFDLTLPTTKATFYFDLGTMPAESVYLAVKTAGATAAIVPALREAVRSVDADQPLFDVGLLDERIDLSLSGRRVPMQLLGLFAIAALLLAAIGIYGVLAFGVAQRTGELGVRVAIGADRGRIVRLVLADGGRLIAAGLLAGIVCAVALGRLLRNQLFGVDSVDPVSLGAVVLVFAAIAMFACWVPARRAARIDPIRALRYE